MTTANGNTTAPAAPVIVTDTNPSAKLRRRCGSNRIECYNSHVPPSSLCAILINDLEKAYFPLRSAPRSVCLQQGSERCCVSWSKHVDGLYGDMLYNAAIDTYPCIWQQGRSGLARDTSLNGVCLTQCLSNRPDGCST